MTSVENLNVQETVYDEAIAMSLFGTTVTVKTGGLPVSDATVGDHTIVDETVKGFTYSDGILLSTIEALKILDPFSTDMLHSSVGQG